MSSSRSGSSSDEFVRSADPSPPSFSLADYLEPFSDFSANSLPSFNYGISVMTRGLTYEMLLFMSTFKLSCLPSLAALDMPGDADLSFFIVSFLIAARCASTTGFILTTVIECD